MAITMAFRQGAHTGYRLSLAPLEQTQAQTVLWGGGRRERLQQCVLDSQTINVVCTSAAVLVLGSVEPWGQGAAQDKEAIRQH